VCVCVRERGRERFEREPFQRCLYTREQLRIVSRACQSLFDSFSTAQKTASQKKATGNSRQKLIWLYPSLHILASTFCLTKFVCRSESLRNPGLNRGAIISHGDPDNSRSGQNDVPWRWHILVASGQYIPTPVENSWRLEKRVVFVQFAFVCCASVRTTQRGFRHVQDQ